MFRSRSLFSLHTVAFALAMLTAAGSGHGTPAAFSADPEYLVETWQTMHGLPENSATSMAQTPDGYLWVGTFGGLARFNGVDFKVFSQNNTPGLPDDGVVNLHVDRLGRLWVSTPSGLSRREPDGRWRVFGRSDGWQGDIVRTFSERPNGDILITSFDGRIVEVSDEKFTELPVPGEAGYGCFGFVDGDGAWWTAQSRFVGRWENRVWSSMVEVPEMDRARFGAAAAAGGGLWLRLGEVVVRVVDGREELRVPLPSGTGSCWALREDSRGDVWMCTPHTGLYRISPKGGIRRWTTENGLAADSLRFTFEDREGSLWVGTNGGGLQRFKRRRFQVIEPGPNSSPPNARSIAPSATGSMWVATYGAGLFKVENGQWTGAPLPADPPSVPYLQSVLEDRAGRLWIGDFGNGVRVVENGHARLLPPEQTGGNNGVALFEDSQERIWMSGGTGIAVIDGGHLRTYGQESGFPAGGVRSFAEDARQRIWVAHKQGVFVLERDLWVPVLESPNRPLRDVTSLWIDPGGSVWMGTRHRGLLRYREGTVDSVTLANGLPSDTILGLIDDLAGNLWMATNLGLVTASIAGLHAAANSPNVRVDSHLLDTHDGLPGLEFASERHPLCARDRDGRLWFPLLRGVAAIDPSTFTPDRTPPPVVIESLSYVAPPSDTSSDVTASDTTVTFQSPLPSGLKLPPGSSRIAIDYAGLSFAAPQKVRYQFKLEGRDTGWRDAQGNRTATFHDLPPRDYVLRVRAANADGVWNEIGASLPFTVLPFYWQTAWFRAGTAALLVALGAGGTWWAARQRHQRIEEKLAFQQQRAELAHLGRVATLSELTGSLAHEINQPLAIILSNAQAAQRLLAQQPPDLEEVREILTDIVNEDRRAGAVIRRLRTLLKRGESSLQPVAINGVVDEVLGLIHSDLIRREVRVERDLAPGLPAVLADRVQLQQVLLNLVTNAGDAMDKTSPRDRCVRIATSRHNGQVRISIADRGCGLPPGDADQVFKPFFTTKTEGLGIGLAICRSIVHAHNGQLRAAPATGTGATFILELPVATPTHDSIPRHRPPRR